MTAATPKHHPSLPTVLVAPDKFKGSLSAKQVSDALSAGLSARASVYAIPLADGGDGSIEAMAAAGFEVHVLDPSISSSPTRPAIFARRGDVVFIESAEFCGLRHLSGKLDPLGSHTLGVGYAVRAALDLGARTIILGVGGTSSTDGGIGFLIGLGAKFLNETGGSISLGSGDLSSLARVDFSGLDPRLEDVELILASDVDSPLLGPSGAARLFAPQKGATPKEVESLELGLTHLVNVLKNGPELWATRTRWADSALGAGAGGGLGFAALLIGAERLAGADFILDLLGIDELLAHCQLVITGEGGLDQQSLAGKLPVALAARARARGLPVMAVVGTCQLSEEEYLRAGFDQVHALDKLDPRCAVDPQLSLDLLTQIGREIPLPAITRS